MARRISLQPALKAPKQPKCSLHSPAWEAMETPGCLQRCVRCTEGYAPPKVLCFFPPAVPVRSQDRLHPEAEVSSASADRGIPDPAVSDAPALSGAEIFDQASQLNIPQISHPSWKAPVNCGKAEPIMSATYDTFHYFIQEPTKVDCSENPFSCTRSTETVLLANILECAASWVA